jgi:Nuclease-related domain
VTNKPQLDVFVNGRVCSLLIVAVLPTPWPWCGRASREGHEALLVAMADAGLACPHIPATPADEIDMNSDVALDGRIIRARFPGSCSRCAAAVARGVKCFHIPSAKTVTCMNCYNPVPSPWPPPPAPGVAGWSADVLSARRGRAGTSYAKGAEGEHVVGRLLDSACIGIGHVLHDRRLPESRRNLDHIVVTVAGVFVVDAKNIAGVPRHMDFGGSLTIDARLCVGRTDRTMWVEGVQSQAAAVREVARVDVLPILCFVGQPAPLTFTVRGVQVVDDSSLSGVVCHAGPLLPKRVSEIAVLLASVFRPA